MIIVSSKELKDILVNEGIGKSLFKDSNRLFDKNYALLTVERLNQYVLNAVGVINRHGVFYKNDSSDCDNFSMWIQAFVTLNWAEDNLKETETPSIAFGRAMIKGHDINIGVADTYQIVYWDYGQITDHPIHKSTTILETEFK